MKIYLVSEANYDWSETLGAFVDKTKAVAMAEGLYEEGRKGLDPTHYMWKRDWTALYTIEEIELET